MISGEKPVENLIKRRVHLPSGRGEMDWFNDNFEFIIGFGIALFVVVGIYMFLSSDSDAETKKAAVERTPTAAIKFKDAAHISASLKKQSLVEATSQISPKSPASGASSPSCLHSPNMKRRVSFDIPSAITTEENLSNNIDSVENADGSESQSQQEKRSGKKGKETPEQKAARLERTRLAKITKRREEEQERADFLAALKASEAAAIFEGQENQRKREQKEASAGHDDEEEWTMHSKKGGNYAKKAVDEPAENKDNSKANKTTRENKPRNNSTTSNSSTGEGGTKKEVVTSAGSTGEKIESNKGHMSASSSYRLPGLPEFVPTAATLGFAGPAHGEKEDKKRKKKKSNSDNNKKEKDDELSKTSSQKSEKSDTSNESGKKPPVTKEKSSESCVRFSKGACNKGNKCKFQHVLIEGGAPEVRKTSTKRAKDAEEPKPKQKCQSKRNEVLGGAWSFKTNNTEDNVDYTDIGANMDQGQVRQGHSNSFEWQHPVIPSGGSSAVTGSAPSLLALPSNSTGNSMSGLINEPPSAPSHAPISSISLAALERSLFAGENKNMYTSFP